METVVTPQISSRDKKRKRQNKKILLLLLITGLTATVLVATTYAWFVGIGTVKVNSFTVGISTDKALEISLDGITWNENITINSDTIQAKTSGGSGLAYTGNTNKWVGTTGLVPVSSSGDNTNGKLNIFSKTSLTATNGGYRIISNQIDNTTEESDKYVTFDLFIKNNSGDVYTDTYNINDDEAVYLTNGTNGSKVTSGASGSSSYGVQNSVRVAFVQVARTSLDSLQANTTPNLVCTSSQPSGTTALCNQATNTYKTVIWEPNEKAHASGLVSYFGTVCKTKSETGGNITYGTACTGLTDGTAVQTYTVKQNISSSNNVDIYDGLNGYTTSISAPGATTPKYLQSTSTFTDTMKDVTTTARQAFFKLAPHSVTKIRVYIYLEGQDVDNYDLITNDQSISVTFGFTKSQLDLTQFH